MSIKNLRKWIEEFNAGNFGKSSVETQIYAGWHDWFCKESSLWNKTKIIGSKLSKINSDFVLDNFYIVIKNNKPFEGRLYDSVRFIPIGESNCDKAFTVVFNSDPRKMKYELIFDSKEKINIYNDSIKTIIDTVNVLRS